MAQVENFSPLIAIVDFHHARGPEIASWIGVGEDEDPAVENDWSLLPFMALSDGAHASVEDFSYFTLCKNGSEHQPARSLFGISCTRQMDVKNLKVKSADFTRSTVQKALVIVTDEPQHFGQMRERLSAVTSAWFHQGDFTDIEILKQFHQSLLKRLEPVDEKDQFIGMPLAQLASILWLMDRGLSLREMIHEFKHQTLVLFKCCLLQPKMLFFGSKCEHLCMIQFSLLSLIPGLIRKLQDCADPALDTYAQSLKRPVSLKTSERASLLDYMGLPLQIFGKGAFFGPYTPLQQLDLLADYGTKSYIVGSTNLLLLQQRDKYSDILINLDDPVSVNITSPSLRSALSLTAADRRWIDFLTQTVIDTWNPEDPSRPSTMEFKGSEEFIRLQFEEYLLALLSSISYSDHLASHHLSSTALNQTDPTSISRPPSPPPDPTGDYSSAFVAHWRTTFSYALWSRHTSGQPLFSVVTPAHPCAGGLTVEDIQRRVTAQIVELKLDERVKEGREALNKHLSAGRERVGAVLGNVWAEMESMRENQRKRAVAAAAARSSEDIGRVPSPALRPVEGDLAEREFTGTAATAAGGGVGWANRKPNIDLAQVQANAAMAKEKVGATLSGWMATAAEKKRAWEENRRQQQQQQQQQVQTATGATKGSQEASRPASATGPVFGAGVGMGKKWTTGGWGWRSSTPIADDGGRVRLSSEEERPGSTGGLTGRSSGLVSGGMLTSNRPMTDEVRAKAEAAVVSEDRALEGGGRKEATKLAGDNPPIQTGGGGTRTEDEAHRN